MEGYTAKPLLLGPDVNRLDEIFESADPADKNFSVVATVNGVSVGSYCCVQYARGVTAGCHSLRVRPTARVLAAIGENMLQIDRDHIYFQIVVRDDGKALVIASYNQIIGSRYLALIPATELDRYCAKEI